MGQEGTGSSERIGADVAASAGGSGTFIPTDSTVPASGIAPPLRAQTDLPPGTRIGSYTVLDVLGRGGMGVVYRAEQQNPRRLVALKLIRPGVASADALQRFA